MPQLSPSSGLIIFLVATLILLTVLLMNHQSTDQPIKQDYSKVSSMKNILYYF